MRQLTSLLVVGNNGRGNKRCDKKCWAAQGTNCKCVCGGLNHGVGLGIAIRNTQAAGFTAALAWCDAHGWDDPRIRIHPDAFQPGLFPGKPIGHGPCPTSG